MGTGIKQSYTNRWWSDCKLPAKKPWFGRAVCPGTLTNRNLLFGHQHTTLAVKPRREVQRPAGLRWRSSHESAPCPTMNSSLKVSWQNA